MGVNKLQFSIDIEAKNSNIWHALWDDNSYREWANIFFEGSYAISNSNWEEGSKVLFLAPDQSGIYSIIEKHEPNECIQFKHIGNVLEGKEQVIDEETKKWTGARESYTLTKEKYYILTIEIDVLDEHLEFMKEKLPLALDKIKFLSENLAE